MNDDSIKYISKMIELIDSYRRGAISLIDMHYNIEALFELIEDIDKSDSFKIIFHKYWDHIEEIIAIGQVDEYLDIINNKILLNFKRELNSIIIDDELI
ncbi:hypothetical protein WKV44_10610 [Spirochaetia bacterium 38H-sp]|uniref:Uncharacterized protein n=1 Tax=Rarispira pelagica TaxID=3141764 RepID=A0ABU9UE84_9SPIR